MSLQEQKRLSDTVHCRFQCILSALCHMSGLPGISSLRNVHVDVSAVLIMESTLIATAGLGSARHLHPLTHTLQYSRSIMGKGEGQ